MPSEVQNSNQLHHHPIVEIRTFHSSISTEASFERTYVRFYLRNSWNFNTSYEFLGAGSGRFGLSDAELAAGIAYRTLRLMLFSRCCAVLPYH